MIYSLKNCRAVIFRPDKSLGKWLSEQKEKPFALINASLYNMTTREPVGTIIENGKQVHDEGNGFGFGYDAKGWYFGKPWDRNYTEYITGYTGIVQNGRYVKPSFTDTYVFDKALNRIGIGKANGELCIVTANSVDIEDFATYAQEQGVSELVNLDGGGSRFLYFDGQTIHNSTRVPYNAIAFYKEKEDLPEEPTSGVIETNFKWASDPVKRTVTDYIVLHHAAADGSAESVHNYHLSLGWKGIAYHYYVRKDGGVYRGRPENTVGGHTQGFNNVSIGICAEGNFNNEAMPVAQRNAIVNLLKDIQKRYPTAKIVQHKDLTPTECAGEQFPYAEIMKMLNPDEGKIFRVQVGAFSKRANAEALARELNSKGYNTIIKEETK